MTCQKWAVALKHRRYSRGQVSGFITLPLILFMAITAAGTTMGLCVF